MAQLGHEQVERRLPPYSLKLVCDGVNGPANIGSLFRLADALGVSELIFANSDPNFNSDRMKRTSRGTDKWIPYRLVDNLKGYLEDQILQGAVLMALEITENSKPLSELRIDDVEKPIVLIIGAENRGISAEVLEFVAPAIFHLPLYGKNSSLNVAQAAAIALYHITQRLDK